MSDRGQQTSPSEHGTPASDVPVEGEAIRPAVADLRPLEPPRPGSSEAASPQPAPPAAGSSPTHSPQPGSSAADSSAAASLQADAPQLELSETDPSEASSAEVRSPEIGAEARSPEIGAEDRSSDIGSSEVHSADVDSHASDARGALPDPGPYPSGHEPVFEIEPEPLEQVAPEQPRSKVRTIVLSGLLAVAVAGAGTLAYVGWQINTQRHTTLSTPTLIGGLTLDDSEDAATTADYLQSALAAEITMDKSVGGVYTGEDDKSVLFFGGTTLLWAPGKELDNSFTLLGDEEGTVTRLREVDAGKLGGTMKCGVTQSDGADMTVCGWADHGSLALAMFLDRTESEAAPLMREIREATQTRG